MSEPTADDLARWAALAEAATAGPWCNYERAVYEDGRILHRVARTDMLVDAEFIAAARTAVPRLLALVAAQAEQIAGLRGNVGGVCIMSANFDASKCLHRGEPEVERLRAELAALHATDDYQRWARAVVERDAAREAVAVLNADVALAWGMSCARVDDIQAATRLLGAIRETLGRAYSPDPEPPR